MPQTTVNLSPENSRKLEVFASQTGKSQDDLVNEAVEQLELPASTSPTEDWKAAIMQAAGMWRDRDDLPDLREASTSASTPEATGPALSMHSSRPLLTRRDRFWCR